VTLDNPAYRIPRRKVEGHENAWVKLFDPPTDSPPTPELLRPTNPVPAFVAATIPGAKESIPATVRRDLLHGLDITLWDGHEVRLMTFRDPDVPLASSGTYPGPTIRVPRGVIFHGETQGKGPPPHTIHWHGIEPTPINDGVGHCSMELGQYVYQWQPNHIGSYFYHCHRNTPQHFEFGLFGFLIVEPPDAYDPGDGKNAGGYPRRTAADLTGFHQFPGFVGGDLRNGDPHAMTVPYDVEALWVLDDIDAVWLNAAPDARATYPRHGDRPGVNDDFRGNAGGGVGPDDFFAFHDFNPEYFFVTGFGFPAPVGGTAAIDAGLTIPPDLNGGVAGMQVPVNARVDQTVLVRVLCAAYVSTVITFPVDTLIIGFDGRALGVPPFGRYNHPIAVPAGTPIELSTARRFDVLIRSATPVHDHATVAFRQTRNNALLFTGLIPVDISA
jgi:FtsP/CotA-like multicopper oxidase with cupredoxin domain